MSATIKNINANTQTTPAALSAPTSLVNPGLERAFADCIGALDEP
jgi:hypothetical protein